MLIAMFVLSLCIIPSLMLLVYLALENSDAGRSLLGGTFLMIFALSILNIVYFGLN